MKIEWINVEFHLEGCGSLKQKRARFRGTMDRLGRHNAVAVAESAHQDSLTRAAWCFLVLGQNQKLVDQTLAEIETTLQLLVDATIISVDRQKL